MDEQTIRLIIIYIIMLIFIICVSLDSPLFIILIEIEVLTIGVFTKIKYKNNPSKALIKGFILSLITSAIILLVSILIIKNNIPILDDIIEYSFY